jgi:hypothetical protein
MQTKIDGLCSRRLLSSQAVPTCQVHERSEAEATDDSDTGSNIADGRTVFETPIDSRHERQLQHPSQWVERGSGRSLIA